MDDRALLRTAADRLDALAARTTAGDWRTGGLLATRPEVIAHRDADGEVGTEHVAEARAGTGGLDHGPLPRRRASPGRAGSVRRPTPRRSSRRLRPWRGYCSSDCPERRTRPNGL